jgi:hypothetical protein
MIREGSLNIIQVDATAALEPAVYTLLFLRNDYHGALATRTIVGRDALLKILKDEVNLTQDALNDALQQFTKKKTASLAHVRLSDEIRLRLGLVNPNEGIG